MNRTDLQAISFRRLEEAAYLMQGKHYAGAYYLLGYVIECALKACIARMTQEHDFPDKKRVNDSYSHDLAQLLRTAGLEQALTNARRLDTALERNWSLVNQWNEGSRYRFGAKDVVQEEAESMLDAVAHREEGILKWLTQFW